MQFGRDLVVCDGQKLSRFTIDHFLMKFLVHYENLIAVCLLQEFFVEVGLVQDFWVIL